MLGGNNDVANSTSNGMGCGKAHHSITNSVGFRNNVNPNFQYVVFDTRNSCPTYPLILEFIYKCVKVGEEHHRMLGPLRFLCLQRKCEEQSRWGQTCNHAIINEFQDASHRDCPLSGA